MANSLSLSSLHSGWPVPSCLLCAVCIRATRLCRDLPPPQLSGQVEAAAHERQALERTLKELSAMKPETETYKVIGKMFLLQTQAELTDQVTAELGEAVSSVEMRLVRDDSGGRSGELACFSDQLAGGGGRRRRTVCDPADGEPVVLVHCTDARSLWATARLVRWSGLCVSCCLYVGGGFSPPRPPHRNCGASLWRSSRKTSWGLRSSSRPSRRRSKGPGRARSLASCVCMGSLLASGGGAAAPSLLCTVM